VPAASQASPSRLAIPVIYGAGLCQGLAFVLIPALGNVLKSAPYSLSNGAYGTLFLPETLGAIGSAVVAGRVAERFGLAGLFRLGLLANLGALALLMGSALKAGSTLSYLLLLAETACLGMGFGLTLAAVNDAATLLFADRASAAVTVLNALIGGGTAISPLLLDVLAARGYWWAWPLLVFLGFALAAAASATIAGVSARGAKAPPRATRVPARLWWFAAAVAVYAICEGTFGSWASIFVHTDRGGSQAAGAWALSAFWGAMTLARVAFGLSTTWLAPRRVYALSPLAIAAAFVIVSFVHGVGALIALFAAAGVACSYFFPFSMSFAIEENSAERARASGLLVAALMLGEGIGSYALGPLQGPHRLTLSLIYRGSALWGVALFVIALALMRTSTSSARFAA